MKINGSLVESLEAEFYKKMGSKGELNLFDFILDFGCSYAGILLHSVTN